MVLQGLRMLLSRFRAQQEREEACGSGDFTFLGPNKTGTGWLFQDTDTLALFHRTGEHTLLELPGEEELELELWLAQNGYHDYLPLETPGEPEEPGEPGEPVNPENREDGEDGAKARQAPAPAPAYAATMDSRLLPAGAGAGREEGPAGTEEIVPWIKTRQPLLGPDLLLPGNPSDAPQSAAGPAQRAQPSPRPLPLAPPDREDPGSCLPGRAQVSRLRPVPLTVSMLARLSCLVPALRPEEGERGLGLAARYLPLFHIQADQEVADEASEIFLLAAAARLRGIPREAFEGFLRGAGTWKGRVFSVASFASLCACLELLPVFVAGLAACESLPDAADAERRVRDYNRDFFAGAMGELEVLPPAQTVQEAYTQHSALIRTRLAAYQSPVEVLQTA